MSECSMQPMHLGITSRSDPVYATRLGFRFKRHNTFGVNRSKRTRDYTGISLVNQTFSVAQFTKDVKRLPVVSARIHAVAHPTQIAKGADKGKPADYAARNAQRVNIASMVCCFVCAALSITIASAAGFSGAVARDLSC
jgi:hypothetical protein